MILAHEDIKNTIIIEYNILCEWIIESPELFSQYYLELWNQINGLDGKFVLSHKDKELAFSKTAILISNPLTIDINEKKIISKVYADLLKIANDERMFIRTKELSSMLQQYFFELEHHYEITLSINEDIELQGLLKLLGVKVETESCDYFEQLLQYIKLQAILLGKKLFILVNIRSYFTEQQIQELFYWAQYNEIYLLLLESFQRDFTNKTKKYIIDYDQCEI